MGRVVGAILLFSAAAFVWTILGSRERMLSTGEFHSVAHKGTGEARIVSTGGRRFLRLLDVRTYPGEDLQVCLVAAPDAEDNDTVRNAGFVCLGDFHAYAAYPIPERIDLRVYRAVTIWSARYQVNFTTAGLGH